MTTEEHERELAKAIVGMECAARAASRIHPEAMTPAQFGQFVRGVSAKVRESADFALSACESGRWRTRDAS